MARQAADSPRSSTSPSAAPGPQATETWDAIFFDEQQVGYLHTVREPIEENGQAVIRWSADSELKIQRFTQPTTQRLRYTSWETPDGRVLRFESAMSSGDAGNASLSLEATGEVRGDQIALRLITAGQTQTATLPWNPEWKGYFGLEQSLERQPLQPGEKRELTALMPGFNQTATVQLAAQDWAETSTLAGPEKLLPIETKIVLAGNPIEQTLWTNRTGQIIKSVMPALKQVTYRTTKEQALTKTSGAFDLGERTIVKVDREIPEPHRTEQITYRATVTGGRAAERFAQGATQRVKVIDENTVELVVRSLRPGEPLGADWTVADPPQPEDRAANSLIQSEDPLIQQLARELAPEAATPWEMAQRLERQVHDLIEHKNFSYALASASEVARSRAGDCTEHAVLLTALCRARNIPARVAIGLVYFRPSQGFAYHMWTEVWIEDRWLPLDSTLGLGGIGAAHVLVSRSNLQGVDPLSQFLPVLQLIGNLQLQVLQVE